MKNRLPLFITGGILLIGLVIGTFFDLEISQAIFSDRNTFGIILTALGLIPGYGLIAFIGGVLFRSTLTAEQPKWLKVILYITSFCAIGIATYFSGNEFFSINGFNIPGVGMIILADAISLIIDSGIFLFGCFVAKGNTNERTWIGVLIIGAAIILSLVSGTTVLKSIFHRPRYRIIQLPDSPVGFYNWYEPCLNYKDYISESIISEQFRSFPSGHAGTSMLTGFFLAYLALFISKLKKHQTLLFIAGFVYCCLISFARILVGAHFLSDVCVGALITLVLMFIANEFIIKFKLFII